MSIKLLPALILATLVAGTADILLAFVLAYLRSGISPDIVLRYIASAIHGRDAFTGPQSMIFIGLLFHFTVTFVIALIVFIVYPMMKWISKHKLLGAVSIGVIAWMVMNLLIVPSTHARMAPFDITDAILGVIVLVVAVGYPLVFFAAAYYRRRAS